MHVAFPACASLAGRLRQRLRARLITEFQGDKQRQLRSVSHLRPALPVPGSYCNGNSLSGDATVTTPQMLLGVDSTGHGRRRLGHYASGISCPVI